MIEKLGGNNNMRIALVGALLALPAAAQVPSPKVSSDCDEPPRAVVLETGLQIDVVYCTSKPVTTESVGYATPNSDGKYYTIVSHLIHRSHVAIPAYVLIYKPNADWVVPAGNLDSLGATALKDGSMDSADHTGWVAQKDFRFHHRSQDWLPARQIVMHNRTTGQSVYYRIIRDTRHNLLYVLYQRDRQGGVDEEKGGVDEEKGGVDEEKGGVDEENRFFDSFTVDPKNVQVDPAKAPGAHLPPPYPYP
jgi:hypothetical protein